MPIAKAQRVLTAALLLPSPGRRSDTELQAFATSDLSARMHSIAVAATTAAAGAAAASQSQCDQNETATL